MTIVWENDGRLPDMPGMESRRIPWLGRLAVIPVTLVSLAAITLAGCGSDSSDNNSPASSPTATATATGTGTAANSAAVCRDVNALEASISDLRDVKLNSNTVTTVRRMADQIRAQLDQLKTDASGSLRPQIDKVSAALKVLEDSLSTAAASPSARNLSVIPGAVTGVTSTANELRQAVPNC
jgi:hypothetical protein